MIFLLLSLLAIAAPHKGADPVLGTWRGNAVFQGANLGLTVRFERDARGLRGTLSSPDLLLLDQPLADVKGAGPRIQFATPDDPPLRFDAKITGDSLHGIGAVPAVPGIVSRAQAAPSMRIALARVQGTEPLPYATSEVRFTSGAATLAGTLFMPRVVAGGRPGVVLLQGSSSNLRREYAFYADHFARSGFAVLTFDKRGKGESSGDYDAATYEQLAGDGAAAIECLRRQHGVDPASVGIWGLSQGAFIAPLVAARAPGVRFIVAVSAPGMPIGESAAYQDSLRLFSSGFDAADVVRTLSLDRRLDEWLRTGKGGDELEALLAEASDAPWRRASSLPARLPSRLGRESWYWKGRTLGPAPWWRAVRVPVLAVYGASDELVPAKKSASLVEHALRKGGNRDVTVRMFPAANHVLRTLPLVAGGKWDWPRAAPGYLELVTRWMHAHAAPPGGS